MEVLATFSSEGEAHLAAGLLEAQGLECKVVSKLPNYVLGPYAGALLVAHLDRAEAIDILSSTPARKRLIVPPSELPPARVLHVEVCPRCGSDRIGPPPRWQLMLLFLCGLAWLPWVVPDGIVWYAGAMVFLACVLLWDRPNRCRMCNHQWRGNGN